MDKCIICGSSKLIYKKTKMSDFLVERIYGVNNVKNGVAVNLCHCLDCSFSFYDKRLTEEERLLYKDYRGKEYQAIREKYDCWYTEKINDALNSDIHALQEHISDPVSFVNKLYGVGNKGTYYYFEVPSLNPLLDDRFSMLKNLELLFNPCYDNIKLIKHFLHVIREPYMPMHEHVNFYTPKSIKYLLERCGFYIICIEENIENGILGKDKVLSALVCKV